MAAGLLAASAAARPAEHPSSNSTPPGQKAESRLCRSLHLCVHAPARTASPSTPPQPTRPPPRRRPTDALGSFPTPPKSRAQRGSLMSLAAGTGGNGTRENAVLPFLSARACSALELTASVNLLFHDKKLFDGQLGGRGKGRGRTRGWKWRCGRPGVTRRRYGRVLAGSSSVLSAQPSFQRGRSRPRAASERAPQRAPAAVLPGYGLRCGPGPLPAAWCLVPGLPRNISAAGGRRAGGNPPLPVCGSPVPTALHPPMLSSFSRPAAAGRRPRAVAVRDLKIGAK